jgi:hypothetical protein
MFTVGVAHGAAPAAVLGRRCGAQPPDILIDPGESMSQHADQPVPGTAQSLVAELGGSTKEFRPGAANVVAGMVFVVGLIGGGLTGLFVLVRAIIQAGGNLPFHVEKGLGWTTAGLFVLVCLGAVAGGICLLIYVRCLRAGCVYVCPRGLVCAQRDHATALPWDEVECVQEIITQDYLPLKGLAKYAAPMGKSRSYRVRRNDGIEEAFDGDSVRKIGKLGRVLREEASKRGIPWQVVERHS